MKAHHSMDEPAGAVRRWARAPSTGADESGVSIRAVFSPMRRFLCVIALLFAAGALGDGQRATAQSLAASPGTRPAGTVTNLFVTLDPDRPIDGVRLRLPSAWTVRAVHLLRFGTRPVPVESRASPGGTVLIGSSSPLQGPHELVVRVHLGRDLGRHRWRITPFVRPEAASSPFDASQVQFRTTAQRTRTVEVTSPPQPDGPNRALDLAEATRSLPLRLPDRLSLDRGAPFTVEFWLRTHGLDEVVLSSWTGVESAAYPFEFVVDQSGRLRLYTGRAGRHHALRTTAPVADGHWHHAAATYDGTRLRLLLDGTVVDSLRLQTLPGVEAPPPHLALGGRRPAPSPAPDAPRLFSGRLDEVRLWPSARAPAVLRQQKNRPLSESTGPDGLLRLSFNDSSLPDPLDWAPRPGRPPAPLARPPPRRALRAQPEGRPEPPGGPPPAPRAGPFGVDPSRAGGSSPRLDRLRAPAGPAPEDGRTMTYTDPRVPGQVVYYRIRQVPTGSSPPRATGTLKVGLGTPRSTAPPVTLIGNFPNPFKASSKIAYRVREAQSITLTVWDVSGKRITTLAEGRHEPGYYERTLHARALPSGTYFARLETAQDVQSHRMILLK